MGPWRLEAAFRELPFTYLSPTETAECFGIEQVRSFVSGDNPCPRPEHIRGSSSTAGCRHCRNLVRFAAEDATTSVTDASEALAALSRAVQLAPGDRVLAERLDGLLSELPVERRLHFLQRVVLQRASDLPRPVAARRPSGPLEGAGPTARAVSRPWSAGGSRRLAMIALAAALAGLIGTVALAVTIASREPGPVKAKRAWMLKSVSSDPPADGIVQGIGPNGQTAFTWAMEGLLSACAFEVGEGRPLL